MAAKKTPKVKTPPTPSVDISEDINENRSHSSAELSQVSALAARMIQIDLAKSKLAERVKELDTEQDRIANQDLPALMEEVGLKEFKLRTGEKIEIKPIISASIPSESAIAKEKDVEKHAEMKERLEKALSYIVKEGGGAMIKNILMVEFGKDSVKETRAAVSALKKLKLTPVVTKGIHPQTLTSWVKEKIANGHPPDFDTFGVYSGTRAVVNTKTKNK